MTTSIQSLLRALAAVLRPHTVRRILFPHRDSLSDRNPILTISPENVRRVIIFRLDEIGDVVLTTPFLTALRHQFPSASVTLVVQPIMKDFFQGCPVVDDVLTYRPAPPGLARVFARWKAVADFDRRLKGSEFDVAVNPRWDVDDYQAGPLVFLTGASHRIGFSETVHPDKGRVNRGFDRYYTHVLTGGGDGHEVKNFGRIMQALGGNPEANPVEAWLTDEDRRWAREVLQPPLDPPRRLLVAVAPGARHERRRWPISHYRRLIEMLVSRFGARIVLIGGADDAFLLDSLRSLSSQDVTSFIGGTSVRQSAALIAQCSLLVGNDSGPVHLAASVHTPVVAISCHPQGGDPRHANAPERFAPWSPTALVVRPASGLGKCTDACREDFAHCISTIEVETVWAAMLHSGFLPVDNRCDAASRPSAT